MAVSPAHGGEIQPLLNGHSPNQGLFTIPSRQWGATNLQFLHMFAGKEFKEIPPRPHNEPGRFPVPIEAVPSIDQLVYGDMNNALTLRPHGNDACCDCCATEHTFDVARDLFADAAAQVTVKMPALPCCFAIGMQGADVELMPKSGVTGQSYKGKYSQGFLPCCMGHKLSLEWDAPGKPKMVRQAPACLDTIKLCMCQTIWAGWRGTSENTTNNTVNYDNSLSLQCDWGKVFQLCCFPCWFCNVCCGVSCTKCSNCCNATIDFAPRWTRIEDVRLLVASKYDHEFKWKRIGEGADEVEHGKVEGMPHLRGNRPTSHVDALFSARLYMDIQCCKPKIRFANRGEGDISAVAATDAIYRGSVSHANPTEDDHLIVLAGLIMHGLDVFPNVDKQPYRFAASRGVKYAGRLLRLEGGAGGNQSQHEV